MAVKAPKVETLAQSMSMLDPGFAEERALINEQMEGLEGLYGSKVQRLEGVRDESFELINSQATGRGVGAAFSGIPIHEQTKYLASEFLPGMQAIEERKDAERMQMRKDLAVINTTQRSQALSRVDQQQSALNQWNLSQMQIEAQREESERQRVWQAQQAELDRSFQASQNAANRASLGPSGPSVSAQIHANLRERAGADRYVSHQVYLQEKAFAADYGMSGTEFDEAFKNYRNPKDKGYTLG